MNAPRCTVMPRMVHQHNRKSTSVNSKLFAKIFFARQGGLRYAPTNHFQQPPPSCDDAATTAAARGTDSPVLFLPLGASRSLDTAHAEPQAARRARHLEPKIGRC